MNLLSRLVDLYAHSGQRPAALRQYEELVRLLKEQMGQDPEEETRRLYEQIRGGKKRTSCGISRTSTSFPLLKTNSISPLRLPSRGGTFLPDCAFG